METQKKMGFVDRLHLICGEGGRTTDILALVNQYCLMRPCYPDGTPVHFHSEVPMPVCKQYPDGKAQVTRICFTSGGFYFNQSFNGVQGVKQIRYKYGDCVPFPEESEDDSLKKLYEDITLPPDEYTHKYLKGDMSEWDFSQHMEAMCRHILARHLYLIETMQYGAKDE